MMAKGGGTNPLAALFDEDGLGGKTSIDVGEFESGKAALKRFGGTGNRITPGEQAITDALRDPQFGLPAIAQNTGNIQTGYA